MVVYTLNPSTGGGQRQSDVWKLCLKTKQVNKQKKWTGEKAQLIKVFAVQTPEFSFQNPLGGRRAMAPGNCPPASKLVL